MTFLFLHGLWPDTINSVVPGGWSIAVEMSFYLLVPFLFAFLNSFHRSLLAICFVLPLSVFMSSAANSLLSNFAPVYLGTGFTYYWLPRQISVFLLGIALYHLIQKTCVDVGSVQLVWWSDGIVAKALTVTGVMLMLVVSAAGTNVPISYFVHSVCFFLVLLGLSQSPSPIIVNKAICFVGNLSFSCYITHFAVLDFVSHHLSDFGVLSPTIEYPVLFILALLLTIIVSYLTYHAIEVPGQWLGGRIAIRVSPRSTLSSSAICVESLVIRDAQNRHTGTRTKKPANHNVPHDS